MIDRNLQGEEYAIVATTKIPITIIIKEKDKIGFKRAYETLE